jgi:hypothetical protein
MVWSAKYYAAIADGMCVEIADPVEVRRSSALDRSPRYSPVGGPEDCSVLSYGDKRGSGCFQEHDPIERMHRAGILHGPRDPTIGGVHNHSCFPTCPGLIIVAMVSRDGMEVSCCAAVLHNPARMCRCRKNHEKTDRKLKDHEIVTIGRLTPYGNTKYIKWQITV